MTHSEIVRRLINIFDCLEDGSRLISNQGQALDGYSALAAFRALAQRAKQSQTTPITHNQLEDKILALISAYEEQEKVSVERISVVKMGPYTKKIVLCSVR